MTDVMSLLIKKNSLRALMRKMNVDQIEKFMENFNSIYTEIIEEKKSELKSENERQRLIMELKALMIQSGITINDILSNNVALHKKRKVKYRLLNKETGVIHEWSGRGRSPAWIVAYELNGGNKHDLLIID